MSSLSEPDRRSRLNILEGFILDSFWGADSYPVATYVVFGVREDWELGLGARGPMGRCNILAFTF